ncbi:arginine N-succinyltransferase [Kistimonas scapharcae]|uniref:Arginine N-succinyltransferase n=1 Tax=Kistimonas scapharcae TaxID=1036133 RepID=A0ABP8V2F5_9GAMM
MLLVRPVVFGDLHNLERLAVMAGGSMSTLPANRDHLAEIIAITRRTLSDTRQLSTESCHFVLEDTETGEICGVAGINAAVGLRYPFYSYRIDDIVHASDELQMHSRVEALRLCHEYTGSANLCSLYLTPEHRTFEKLELLSRARLLFIAVHRAWFGSRIMVELQGVRDQQGRSPFWECLGRHFFSMALDRAVYLAGIKARSFIADMMPKYPVYMPLLSEEARGAIGCVHPERRDVLRLLEDEGFEFADHVDIFDAGPQLEARLGQLRTLREADMAEADITDTHDTEATHLVCNAGLLDFRCLQATADAGKVSLSAGQADALRVSAGDPVLQVAADNNKQCAGTLKRTGDHCHD